jgi:hypothetical protein
MKNNFLSLKFVTVVIVLELCLIVMIAGCLQPNRSSITAHATPSVSPPVDTTGQSSIAVAVTSGNLQAVSTSTPYNTYSNSAYRFNLEYPSDWNVNELSPAGSGAKVTQIPSGFGPRYKVVEFYAPTYSGADRTVLQIEVDPAPFTSSLEDYYVKDVAWLSTTNHQLEITKHQAIYSLSGKKAYRFDYHIPSLTQKISDEVNVQRAYAIIGGKAYIITYRAYGITGGDFEKYYNTAQGMFESFKTT